MKVRDFNVLTDFFFPPKLFIGGKLDLLSLMMLSEFSLVCKNFGFYFVKSVQAFFSHQRN